MMSIVFCLIHVMSIIVYTRAFRESNAVCFEKTRDNHANVVGYSLNEIQTVLDELHQIMAEESTLEAIKD
ncbi:MAG: hypothetical protein LBK00_09525 [Treponema sp.]|jgi:hypothetical protein|nr:hypothetical protein [Treponema sp.]